MTATGAIQWATYDAPSYPMKELVWYLFYTWEKAVHLSLGNTQQAHVGQTGEMPLSELPSCKRHKGSLLPPPLGLALEMESYPILSQLLVSHQLLVHARLRTQWVPALSHLIFKSFL